MSKGKGAGHGKLDAGAGARQEALAFSPSSGTSIGVEVEMQILDRDTGDLAAGAVGILNACRGESLAGVSSEFMQSMLEIKTGICKDVSEVERQLYPLARRVRNIASSMGYEIALAGTHPFGRSSANAIFPNERYARILDRTGWVGTHDLIFGVHVHVGVPSGEMAIGLINALVQYLPHMLALSCNSPYWQGVDTGLASFRAAFFGLKPRSGVPPYFANWHDCRSYMQMLLGAKAIGSLKDIHWDIRPRPDFGTIEFRIFDAPLTLRATLGLAALTRTLVIAAERRLAERPQLCRGDARRQWMALENKWSAIRYGLQGTYLRAPSGKRRSLAHDAAELLDRLLPIARESGDDRFLRSMQPLDSLELGAATQRRVYRESGSWQVLMGAMAKRFADELAERPPRAPPQPH